MKRVTLLILVLLFCSTVYSQSLTLENALPAHSTDDQIVKHLAYILKYSEQFEQAEWFVYMLSSEYPLGSIDRTDNSRADPGVITGSAGISDCKGSGYVSEQLVKKYLVHFFRFSVIEQEECT